MTLNFEQTFLVQKKIIFVYNHLSLINHENGLSELNLRELHLPAIKKFPRPKKSSKV